MHSRDRISTNYDEYCQLLIKLDWSGLNVQSNWISVISENKLIISWV